MRYALQITENNLPLIAILNDGVTPRIEYGTTYFVYDSDPEGHSRILSMAEYVGDKNLYVTRIGASMVRIHM